MLKENKFDIISICTPIQTHFEIIKACIDAGVKSIFCEKTISYSLKEIDEIISLCKANNTPNERMVDAILNIIECLNTGKQPLSNLKTASESVKIIEGIKKSSINK
ncbi:Gfo/Idh/MocA family oxidoreductase [Actinobacillus porcinus]|uniref:Gfo/Idh/MocA family oxidoreductase n=1 Tax=Actinobacillus porcinus TaxID=51048 RepID=UPI0023568CB2|nr:Gfo/Idh/MocA family oxidoreductase [Actinobacillus porcinus]